MLTHHQPQEQPQRRDIDSMRENTPALACEILTAQMQAPTEREAQRAEQLSQSAAWSRDPLFKGWESARLRASTEIDWKGLRDDYLKQVYGDNA